MTVRVERRFTLESACETVWKFIADPEKRAEAISVVSGFELDGPEGRTATWHVDLPIPVINRTVAVETEDVERDSPRYVMFVGRSKVMRVTGEHRLEQTDAGCVLTNRFVVDGKLPGVERFFKRQLDEELDNLEAAIREEIRAQ